MEKIFAVALSCKHALCTILILQFIVNILLAGHYLGKLKFYNLFFTGSRVDNPNDNYYDSKCINISTNWDTDKFDESNDNGLNVHNRNETQKPTWFKKVTPKNAEYFDREIIGIAPEILPLITSVPMIVHQILWNDQLTFRNYLSILSVWKILKPYQIYLHVRKSFSQKEFVYNDWYQKAILKISSLQVFRLEFLNKKTYSIMTEQNAALTLLKEVGGVYVNINTIIVSSIWLKLRNTLSAVVAEDFSLGYLAMPQSSKPPENITGGLKEGLAIKCVNVAAFTGSQECIMVQQEIFPYNIMWDNCSFAELARTLFYGKPDMPYPSRKFPPIPKIVHYVWFGSGHIDYSMYLSFLSTQRFIHPQQVRIYINTNNTSPFLKKMAEAENVKVIFYGPLKTIFQKPVKAVSHASDFLRADVLYRFGGMYIDWDVYWLKPIDDLIWKGFETIASLDYYDDMFPRKEYPDTINMGVLLSRPESRFIALWRDSYRKYTGGHHTWHAVENVYKLYEENPDLLVIDKRLQIMCHELRCHPLWLNDYKNTTAHHEFDFKNDVYAVHFTAPTPKAFTSEKLILESGGYFAEMARHILGKS